MSTNGVNTNSRPLRAMATALLLGCLVASVASAPVVGAEPGPIPTPAQLATKTGQWYSHGRSLELRDDGSGTLAAWVGAFDGTLIDLSLIPAPGAATVAEVTGVRTAGQGALGPSEIPGQGALVTMRFGGEVLGEPVDSAHVEWSAGPKLMSAELCPAVPLTPAQMEALRCGA